MEITREHVVKTLTRVLEEGQEAIEAEPVEITEDTRPIGDLGDFDSLASLMATVRCLDALNLSTHDEIQTLFVGKDDDGRLYARTVREIADTILELKPMDQKGDEDND